MPRAFVLALIAALLGLTAIGFVSAQDTTTTTDTGGACASPVASPTGSAVVGMAASPMVGTPCASPVAQSGQANANPTVTLADIKFDPKTFTIPANTDVTVTLINKGAAVHSFNIDELNVHSGDVQPGTTTTVTINAKPGTYTYYCSIPGHKDAGMVGQLTVQ